MPCHSRNVPKIVETDLNLILRATLTCGFAPNAFCGDWCEIR